MALSLYSPVTELSGIGEIRSAQLKKLGIHSVYDLLAYFPRDYEDRTKIVQICDLQSGEPACFTAMVTSSPQFSRLPGGKSITKVQVADDSGKVRLVFFNKPYVSNQLHYGESYRFFGTLDAEYHQLTNPDFEPISSDAGKTGRLMPIYGLTAGLSNQVLVKTVTQAMDACMESIPELLPPAIRQRYSLCEAAFAYQTIHNPMNYETLAIARRRLVFEEFFVFSAGLQLLKNERHEKTGQILNCSSIKEFTSSLPYALTGAQAHTIDRIVNDFLSGKPMNRLVQGDVGSGKTVVAAAAAFLAAKNGLQTAMMAPTEILAEQHAVSLSMMMEPFGIGVCLLTGSMTAAQKKTAKEKIASGAAQIIIGTHALLTQDVEFQSLGLVIADEQHRFGVAQRARLEQKGTAPHLLVMSATPIPRTLALIAYGELDVSIIDELPPGRQKIDTFLVGEDMRRRINAFIEKQCALGGQAYIICPAVEDGEIENLKSVQTWAETLQTVVFPNLKVGLLHGRMKGEEKEAVMRRFAQHETDILVSTTVVEVGVDVANANLIVIENAERFGLSQLHQLRGRVGRGERKSYCILFSSNRSESTKERLKTLVESSDGFEIAQKDLALRGPGDFFGSRQHGLPLFKAASLEMDLKTLEQAQQAAQEVFSTNEAAELEPLKNRIRILFEEQPVTLN